MKITLLQLNKICPAIVGVRGQLIVDALNDAFQQYNIQPYDANALIANLIHESREFTRFEENLNYSAAALSKLFGRHRISINQCNMYGRIDGKQKANKKAIANTIYGGNWGKINLGNTVQNDGWELRGSGALQMTGRAVITLFTVHWNKLKGTQLTVYNMAALLRDKPNITLSINAACWFIREFKRVSPGTSFTGYVLAINGGLNGIDDRLRYFNRGAKILI